MDCAFEGRDGDEVSLRVPASRGLAGDRLPVLFALFAVLFKTLFTVQAVALRAHNRIVNHVVA